MIKIFLLILIICIIFFILYIISQLFKNEKFDNNKKNIYSIIEYDKDHQQIINAGDGASEFLYYITMYKLSKIYNLTILYNSNDKIIDNVNYVNKGEFNLIKDINNSIIIVQRNFNLLINLYELNNTNKYILWTHDHYYGETKETMNKFIKFNIPIVVISEYHKKHWTTNYPGINTHIIYNALFPEFFIKNKTDESTYNKDHIIVASGWAQRDMSKVFKITSEYYKKNNNFRLLLITPSYSPDDKIDKTEYPFIIQLGNLKNKTEYSKLLQSCLCVMSTSSKETFGCVFAEALHLGVPVIVDNTNSGTNEVVPIEQICDFNNTEEVIQKIEEYRNNRPVVYLNEKFYETAVINKWCELIDNL